MSDFLTGGAESTADGYIYHQFTADGTATVLSAGLQVEYLVVGGGGGGGGIGYNMGPSGGGGGGEVVWGTATFSAGAVAVTVGAGGTAGQQSDVSRGGNGGSSILAGYATATGGGGGGANSTNSTEDGLAGASGGGAGYLGTGGAGLVHFDGGDGDTGGPGFDAGGGGGAGAAGVDGTAVADPVGGDGLEIVSFASFGDSGWFGGGGGAGDWGAGAAPEAGGQGGGGGGSLVTMNGTANTGGGGSGMSNTSFGPGGDGGVGGSGVVLLRYAVPTPPDPDSGWWIEVWDLDNQNKLMDDWVPAVNCVFERVFNDIGSGSLTVPASWSRIGVLCDPPNDVSTLVKVYIDDRFRYAFRADQVERTYDELGNSVVRVFGPGWEEIVNDGEVPPKDYPANPTKVGPWEYGFQSIFNQGSFEAGPNAFGTASVDSPTSTSDPIGWSTTGGASVAWSTAQADGGTYSYLVTPAASGDGIERYETKGVWSSERYKFTARVKGASNGSRIVAGIAGPNPITTTHSTNTFLSGGEAISELGNVAQGNGSTDGTWQTIEVEVTLPSTNESLECFVRYEGGTLDDFYVDLDNTSLTGTGINLPLYQRPVGLSTFAIGTAQVAVGTYSLEVGSSSTDETHRARLAIDWASSGLTVDFNSSVYDTSDSWSWTAYDRASGSALATSGTTGGTAGFVDLDMTFDTVGSSGVYVDFESATESATAYIDNISITSGEAVSWGAIVGDILAATQSQGNATALTDTFSDSADSDGAAWAPSTLSLVVDDGQPFGRVLDRGVGLGYEWEIAPTSGWGGGEDGIVLRVYNAGNLGTDYTGLSTSPTIRQGSILFGGRSRQHIAKNVVRVEVADGYWAEATDAASTAAVGRRMETVSNPSVAGTATAQEIADARLAVHQQQSQQLWVQATEDSEFRPFLDYNIGDTIKVEMDEPLGVSGWFRVHTIRCDLTGEGNEVAYVVDLRP